MPLLKIGIMKFSGSHIILLVLYLANTMTDAQVQSLSPKRDGWSVGQSVHTSSGTVRGRAAPNATEVSVYLGIPYAKPPIGNLRFAPPQKYESDNGIDATDFISPVVRT
jgi:cholinesterase